MSRFQLLLLVAALPFLASTASAQRFAYAADGFGSSPPSGTTTYELDNDDGWDGSLTIDSNDETAVEDDLETAGCTVTSGSPTVIDCPGVEDYAEVSAYIIAMEVEISPVRLTGGTEVRAEFGDGAEAWAWMPSAASSTAMEIMEESSDPDCTWTCTKGIPVLDENGNDIPPYITCLTDTGPHCCTLECDPDPTPPDDGPERVEGSLERLGSVSF